MVKQSLSVLVTHYGDFDALVLKQHPLPEIGADDVSVSVHYCGLNFSDIYTRKGIGQDRKFPFVLGMECSGIVEAVGSGNHGIKVGQKVVCYEYTGGMYRTSVVVPAAKCYVVPDGVDLKIAAAMFVNYLTAYFCLYGFGCLRPREHILVHSCAGGVGWAVTQLARQVKDVVIYGTVSETKADRVKANGVTHVLNYDTFDEQIRALNPKGLDLILENQGGLTVRKNMKLLRSLGKMVVLGANNAVSDNKGLAEDALNEFAGETSMYSLLSNNMAISGIHLGVLTEKEPAKVREALKSLFAMYTEKRIEPQIDSVWPLEKIVDATKVLTERRNVGKVLLSTGRGK